MAQETFIEPKDMGWLKEVHLLPLLRAKSAILYGNEDSPEYITLYARANPDYDDQPLAVIDFTTGPQGG